MSGTTRPNGDTSPPELTQRIDRTCDRFEAAWKAGQRPPIEAFLVEVPAPGRPALFHELLALDREYRRRGGEEPTAGDYRPRFPEHSAVITAVFAEPHRTSPRPTAASTRRPTADPAARESSPSSAPAPPRPDSHCGASVPR
jgi:serine/threonine-protein kinase